MESDAASDGDERVSTVPSVVSGASKPASSESSSSDRPLPLGLSSYLREAMEQSFINVSRNPRRPPRHPTTTSCSSSSSGPGESRRPSQVGSRRPSQSVAGSSRRPSVDSEISSARSMRSHVSSSRRSESKESQSGGQRSHLLIVPCNKVPTSPRVAPRGRRHSLTASRSQDNLRQNNPWTISNIAEYSIDPQRSESCGSPSRAAVTRLRTVSDPPKPLEFGIPELRRQSSDGADMPQSSTLQSLPFPGQVVEETEVQSPKMATSQRRVSWSATLPIVQEFRQRDASPSENHN